MLCNINTFPTLSYWFNDLPSDICDRDLFKRLMSLTLLISLYQLKLVYHIMKNRSTTAKNINIQANNIIIEKVQ